MTDRSIVSHIRRPNRAHFAGAIALSSGIVLVGLLAVPYGAVQLGMNPGFLPAFGSLTFIGDLITALLLFSQAKALDDAAFGRLGAAYFFSAAIIIPHLLAFPGVFSPTPLIGTSASAVWLWAAWHGGFALGVVNFAYPRSDRPGRPVRVLIIGGWVVGIVVLVTLVTTVFEFLLPTILVNGSYARMTSLGIGPAVMVCSVAGLVLVAWQLRNASTITVWLTVAMIASTMDVFLTLLGNGRFTLGWYLARSLSLVAGITVMCTLLADLVRLFNHVAVANTVLEKLSLTDPLTELANRRAFEQRLDEEWRRAAREQLPLSLVMIDIDHFKRYNDHFGHPAGDECLRDVAKTLTTGVRRPLDMPARLGGEEFAVLLPLTEHEGAALVAEKFRANVERMELRHHDQTVPSVTVSVGVATVFPHGEGETQKGLMDAADAALYRAKHAGRNQVCQHTDPGTQAVVEALRRHLMQRSRGLE